MPTPQQNQLLFRTQTTLGYGLVSYYMCEELSGDLIDATGRGNTLTANNAPGTTTGKVSRARSFVSGSTQYFGASDNADWSMGDIDFTITCWVNLNTSAGTTQGMVAKWNDSGGQREWFLGAFSDRFQFGISSTGSNETFQPANTLGAPSTGVWYFVVAWHDSVANTINIQVNNGAIDSTSYSLGGRDGTAACRIGAYRDTAFLPLNGALDEIRIYKRVLAGIERTTLFNGNGYA